MTKNNISEQYLLVDTKFLSLFQEMFEQVTEFIEEWEVSIPNVLSDGDLTLETKGDLMVMDSGVERMKDILRVFNHVAKEDMIEKTVQNTRVIGEA
tara:strand:- start:90 stop:377 length:288 start_codon:yes stop_codon:yes gene_type:complete